MKALIKLLRPHQWIKNSFVLVGLLYSHQWYNVALMQSVLITFIAFCSLASAVYIYNDYCDRQIDCLHPRKKNRPLTSGQVTLRQAIYLLIVLLVITVSLGFVLPWRVNLILFSYTLLNLVYSHYLKFIPIIDIFTIALGFMLRILAGTWAIGIAPSMWLLFCTGMLTLFLGFCKRYAENLPQYSPNFLSQVISITAACSMVSYGLYALDPATMQIHHTKHLIYTEPLVIYGILRYLYQLYHLQSKGAEDTAKTLWQDHHLWLTLATWLILTLYLLT